MILLDKRMVAVLKLMAPSEEAVDVGADHGWVSAAILERGLARRVTACDISAPSLEKAKRLARQRGLEEQMRFLVANGFSGYAPVGSFCAVIAGMGGELIADILSRGGETPRKALRLVMQPMGGAAELRAWLLQNGYAILDETVIRQGQRFYQLIAAGWRGGRSAPLPPWEALEFGPVALEKKEQDLLELLKKTRRARMKQLEQAEKAGVELPKLSVELAAVERLLAEWEEMDET